MAKRTYNSWAGYADAYFWSIHADLKEEVAEELGDEYVNEPYQIGIIIGKLRDFGCYELAQQLQNRVEEESEEDL